MSSPPIRVLVVDDEPIARRGIRQLLAAHDDVEVVGEAPNGNEAVRLLRALTPDLLIIDVQMPGLDGFAVLRQIAPDKLPAFIFVTAHDSFAVRAFEARALDYLVKPVIEARFDDALSRARERLCSGEALEQSRRMILELNGNQPAKAANIAAARRVIIGTTGSELILDVLDISWIEADDYYAAVHVRGRRHLVRESLSSLETRLDPRQFVRVHRCAIVNLAEVREMKRPSTADPILILKDGSQVPLSRRRRQTVERAIRRFAR